MSELPLLEDDLGAPGIIDPSAIHQPGAIPPRAVACFFNDVVTKLHRDGVLEHRTTLHSEIGANPIYTLELSGQPLTVFHPGVGAPLAAGFVEEVIALGATHFVACGGAGALVEDLVLGHPVIVNAAIRDEGTSFHYLAPSRRVDADPHGVAVLEALLTERGINYLTGCTWTTDAIFRETRARVDRRVAEGCLTVDMEASAFMAVAQFRQVCFAQLLYAGDSLAGETWDERCWMQDRSSREALFWLAAEAALRL